MPAAQKLALVTPLQQSKEAQPRGELTKAVIESAPPGTRIPYRNRMYLQVSTKGVRTWRWMYRLFDPARACDAQFQIKLGVWPAMGIKAAEAAQAKAWSDYVQHGQHPPQHRQEKLKAQAEAVAATKADTVWTAVHAWYKANAKAWVPSYALQVMTYSERYLGPATVIGSRPLAKVTRKEIKDAILAVAEATPSVGRLIKQWLNAALEHAADGGEIEINPMAGMKTKTAAPNPNPTVNSPVLAPADLRHLMHAVQGYRRDRRIRLMLLLLCHTAVRSSELRCADWTEFDLVNARWTIPAARMKMRRMHIVPLSPQVIALLRELQEVTGTTGLLFKNENDPLKPMPQSSARAAVYRLTAKEFSPHGFRSTFSTLANEADYPPHHVDAVLAHGKKNRVEASYNKSTYYPQREALMRDWSVYLDALVTGPVVP